MKRSISLVVALFCICPSVYAQKPKAVRILAVDVKQYDETEYKQAQEFIESYAKANDRQITDIEKQTRLEKFIEQWRERQLTIYEKIGELSVVNAKQKLFSAFVSAADWQKVTATDGFIQDGVSISE